MITKCLSGHHTPVTTVDELWYLAEATWIAACIHAIQFLYDSVPRDITAVNTTGGDCSKY